MEAAIGASRCVVVQQLARSWAEQMSYYRLLHHPAVTVEALLRAQAQESGLAGYSGHLLALTDTTELDLTSRRTRLAPSGDTGPIGNGRNWGLLVQPVLCLRATPAPAAGAPSEEGAYGEPVLGVGSLDYWHRDAAAGNRFVRQARRLPLAERESAKWARAGAAIRAQAPRATRITLVADRESDDYATLAQWRALDLDFLIRSRCDRRLLPPSGPSAPSAPSGPDAATAASLDKLWARLPTAPLLGEWTIEVACRQATALHPTRAARLELRAAPVVFRRPNTAPGQVPELPLWGVWVTEADPPAGEPPLCWRLLTTHAVDTAAQARQVAGWYAQRWWIEQLFRVLKQQGLRLEETQLADGQAVMRLLALALALPTAVRVMQLACARARPTPVPPTVLPLAARPLARQWVQQLEGRTAAQRNPYPPESWAWLTWLLGRLGGWKGLPSQGPPGVSSLCRGDARFWQYWRDSQLLHPELVYKP